MSENNGQIANWADADRVLGEIRRTDASVAKLQAARDEAVRKVMERFADLLDQAADARKAYVAALRAFCTKRRKTDFADARSKQLDNGVVGWRLGNPKLGLLNKAKDWTKALVKVLGAGRKAYVRILRELAKDRILADHKAGRLSDEQLAAWDLRVTQAERFYIEPTSDDGRDRQAES